MSITRYSPGDPVYLGWPWWFPAPQASAALQSQALVLNVWSGWSRLTGGAPGLLSTTWEPPEE